MCLAENGSKVDSHKPAFVSCCSATEAAMGQQALNSIQDESVADMEVEPYCELQ